MSSIRARGGLVRSTPGADACDSERLFGNVPATDLYRQFVFAWEQTVLPRSELDEVPDRNLRITWA